MPLIRFYRATCPECETETDVAEEYWPATRYEPADGVYGPEECPKCGHPWGYDDLEAIDPPEPDFDDYRLERQA